MMKRKHESVGGWEQPNENMQIFFTKRPATIHFPPDLVTFWRLKLRGQGSQYSNALVSGPDELKLAETGQYCPQSCGLKAPVADNSH